MQFSAEVPTAQIMCEVVPQHLTLTSPTVNCVPLIGNFLSLRKTSGPNILFLGPIFKSLPLIELRQSSPPLHRKPQRTSRMRPLTEEETQAVFKKLAEYTGASLKNIIAPQEDGDRNVFRLSQNRVYLVRLSMANLATSISRDNLLSLGTCLGMRYSSSDPSVGAN